MSVHANEKVLRDYMRDVWEQQNPAAAIQYLAPDYKRHTSPLSPPLDMAEQLQRLRAFRTAFPNVVITIKDVVSGSDRVAFRSIMTGTHEAALLGIPPTGRKVTVELIDVIRLKNGRFLEQWGGPNMYDLARQLGAEITLPADTSE